MSSLNHWRIDWCWEPLSQNWTHIPARMSKTASRIIKSLWACYLWLHCELTLDFSNFLLSPSFSFFLPGNCTTQPLLVMCFFAKETLSYRFRWSWTVRSISILTCLKRTRTKRPRVKMLADGCVLNLTLGCSSHDSIWGQERNPQGGWCSETLMSCIQMVASLNHLFTFS